VAAAVVVDAPVAEVAAGTTGVAAAGVRAIVAGTTGVATTGAAAVVRAAMADRAAAVAPAVPAEAVPEVRVRVAARLLASRRVAHPVVRPVSNGRAIGPATSTAAGRRPPMSVCPTVGYRTDACRTVGAPTVDVRTVAAPTADPPIVMSARRRRPVCRSASTNRDYRPKSTPVDCRVGSRLSSVVCPRTWPRSSPATWSRRAC